MGIMSHVFNICLLFTAHYQITTKILHFQCVLQCEYSIKAIFYVLKNPMPTLYPLSSVSCNYQCQCCCVHNFKSTRKDMETHSKHSKLIGFKLGLYQKDQTTASFCIALKKYFLRSRKIIRSFLFVYCSQTLGYIYVFSSLNCTFMYCYCLV